MEGGAVEQGLEPAFEALLLPGQTGELLEGRDGILRTETAAKPCLSAMARAAAAIFCRESPG